MIEFTDTAIPVSLISKIKESKLLVYRERKDVTPSPNDLAYWLFLFFIVTAAFSNREFACGKCLSTLMLPIERSLYQLSDESPVNT